jgi:hypothetical protein
MYVRPNKRIDSLTCEADLPQPVKVDFLRLQDLVKDPQATLVIFSHCQQLSPVEISKASVKTQAFGPFTCHNCLSPAELAKKPCHLSSSINYSH